MFQDLIDRIQSYSDKPLQKIESIEHITHDAFYKSYMKKNKPVVMTQMMNDWEATKSWSLDYFKDIGKNKEAYMAKGNNFQEDTKWEYGSFLKSIEAIEDAEKKGEKAGYLMNLSLVKMFPKLREHVDFSLISNYKVRDSLSFWIGPKGTITSWHTDRLADNILAQIHGHKLVLLASPKDSKYMHKSSKYEPGSQISSVNLESFDPEKYPLYKKNVQVHYIILEPGKMVFIPKEWWHCVYGLDLSISSNNFGFSAIDNFKMKANEFVRRKLHNAGLYGKDCVCHFTDENGNRKRYQQIG